jgi:hypothetical protein
VELTAATPPQRVLFADSVLSSFLSLCHCDFVTVPCDDGRAQQAASQ